MPDLPSEALGGTRRFFHLFVLLIGYAVAGLGAALLLDGAIKVASLVIQERVFTSPTSVSQDFVVSISVAAGGILLFFIGRAIAIHGTERQGLFGGD